MRQVTKTKLKQELLNAYQIYYMNIVMGTTSIARRMYKDFIAKHAPTFKKELEVIREVAKFNINQTLRRHNY